jgi:hypothetical protein
LCPEPGISHAGGMAVCDFLREDRVASNLVPIDLEMCVRERGRISQLNPMIDVLFEVCCRWLTKMVKLTSLRHFC